MRTLILFASILWALTAPVSSQIKVYLRSFLFITAVLEGMLLFHRTNNYTVVYRWTYWACIAFVSVLMPAALIYWARAEIFTSTHLRILLAAWALMLIYYYAYFQDWHSARFDWVPSAIYVTAFTALGAVARAGSQLRTPSQP